MKHRYNYNRKQDVWGKGRYSSKRRDWGMVIAMLVVGGTILGVIMFLLLKK